MSKAIVNMINWQLYVYDNNYTLSGTAYKHPTFGKNAYVSQTSSLVNYTFADDVLICETRNTIYVCPLKYMIIWPYRNVVVEYREKLTHRAELSESTLDKIIAATAKLSILETSRVYENPGERVFKYYYAICQIKKDYSDDELLNHIIELQPLGQKEIIEMKQNENNRLINIASNYENSIYIEVSNVGCGSLLAYHLGDYKGVVEPYLHSGMFQDSVLYVKYEKEDNPCSLDFRYWPNGCEDSIETYSWSENIVKAVIKNETNYSLEFNKFNIPIGETMIFTQDGHR